MKGDYLFKQEMLRKGLKSCIIWIIIILLVSAGFYIASFFLYSQNYSYKLGQGPCSQAFNVPFYKCPVEIEAKVTGPYLANFYLTEEQYKEDPGGHSIANASNVSSFSYKGEMSPGKYVIVVEKSIRLEDPDSTGESKAIFKSIDIFILKPLVPIILIGGGVLETLLVFWLISIIIRRRNLTKEMILSNTTGRTEGKEEGDYYSSMYEDRNAAKHKEYDDIFPHSDGLSSFEKSKLPKYRNDADSLYQDDYHLKKKRKDPGRRNISREPGFEPYSRQSSENEKRERRNKGTLDPTRRGGPSSAKDRRGTGRRIPSRSEMRERRGKGQRGGPHYDIEYIPPGAHVGKPERREYGGSSGGNREHGYHRPGRTRSRNDEDEIDWG